jgi:hypothetical protein
VWDGQGWSTGLLSFSNLVTRAALGVTSWTDTIGTHIRGYYGTSANVIKEKCWDGSGNWVDGSFSQPSIPASNVAAIPLNGLRVYIQNGTQDTAVTEFVWNHQNWAPGRSALPPA